MKGKKTLAMILLLVTLCFCLTACDPPQFYHDYEDLIAKVVGIELINYSNLNEKTIDTFNDKNPEKRILPFEFDKMEMVETLPPEKFADFLQDFSEIFIVARWNHPNCSNGLSIRLIFDDATFKVISKNSVDRCFIALYDENGNVIEYVGGMDTYSFNPIVNKYFSMQVD